MYIGEVLAADCANGIGMRVSVFVSGCTNRCKGCFQPETWDFHYGVEYTQDMEDKILKELSRGYYDGLTILGGEPFELENQEEVARLVRRVRKEIPERTIWMYTGFIYDQDLVPGGSRYGDKTDEILDNIDVLVDGRFVIEQKSIGLLFRGSTNQRIIDMKQTRASQRVVLDPLNDRSE
ncbi:MAG: anaerobic ribonucleoside-triphosphate reductase activating protein [Lachnospiraceae bacterium]|nr:anaerobic ribonucleoside-triphosphate reductase activating protein [Lachnospiraceae bacterium]